MAKAKRSEAEIMRDIDECYSRLSPENLTCDGECSGASVRRRYANLMQHLRGLFVELGREVEEIECMEYVRTHPAVK